MATTRTQREQQQEHQQQQRKRVKDRFAHFLFVNFLCKIICVSAQVHSCIFTNLHAYKHLRWKCTNVSLKALLITWIFYF